MTFEEAVELSKKHGTWIMSLRGVECVGAGGGSLGGDDQGL